MYLDQAVKLKSNLAAIYYVASEAYIAENDSVSAMQSAALAVEYAQDDPQAWYNLGVISYNAKKYAEAATAFEQALARQEKFANALYALGLTYYELKRTPDAINMFEALDQLDPSRPAVRQILSNLRAGRPPIAQPAAPRSR